MSSSRDFLVSTVSDALLPHLKQILEDVVMETLNAQQVPTRTDLHEQRDLLNSLRGQVGASAGGLRKLQERLDALEAEVEALKAEREALLMRLRAEG